MSSSHHHDPSKTSCPPPPPPPPPPVIKKAPTPPPAPKPPTVAPEGPPGAFLVELLIYNGSPFKDHWSYFVRSHGNPNVGVKIHATGDVRNGFKFEVKRNINIENTEDSPSTRIPLQWVAAKHFDEGPMLNYGKEKIDTVPVCGFEASAYKVKAPGKTLNAVDNLAQSGKKITQKDCQSWLVESANYLVQDQIFENDVAVYLREIQQ